MPHLSSKPVLWFHPTFMYSLSLCLLPAFGTFPFSLVGLCQAWSQYKLDFLLPNLLIVTMDELPTKDQALSEDGSLYGVSDDSIDLARRTSFVDDEVENRYFGRSENRKVRGLKALVFLALFLVTLAVCLVIFFLTAAGQRHEFEAS